MKRIACILLAAVLAAPAAAAPSRGKVLVVLSSASSLKLREGREHATGFYLNELGVPTHALVEAGYEVVVCDPLGNQPTMDAASDKASYFGGDEARHQQIRAFVDGLLKQRPMPLASVAAGDLAQYRAVFVPGGHAPMMDLWNNAALGQILRSFHQTGRPTALICHGPVALLSTRQGGSEGSWPYAGYQMTVFSDAEEKPNEGKGKLGGFMLFYPEDALRAAGGRLSVGPPRESHVVHDRELITGQNPFSDAELAKMLLEALGASP